MPEISPDSIPRYLPGLSPSTKIETTSDATVPVETPPASVSPNQDNVGKQASLETLEQNLDEATQAGTPNQHTEAQLNLAKATISTKSKEPTESEESTDSNYAKSAEALLIKMKKFEDGADPTNTDHWTHIKKQGEKTGLRLITAPFKAAAGTLFTSISLAEGALGLAALGGGKLLGWFGMDSSKATSFGQNVLKTTRGHTLLSAMTLAGSFLGVAKDTVDLISVIFTNRAIISSSTRIKNYEYKLIDKILIQPNRTSSKIQTQSDFEEGFLKTSRKIFGYINTLSLNFLLPKYSTGGNSGEVSGLTHYLAKYTRAEQQTTRASVFRGRSRTQLGRQITSREQLQVPQKISHSREEIEKFKNELQGKLTSESTFWKDLYSKLDRASPAEQETILKIFDQLMTLHENNRAHDENYNIAKLLKRLDNNIDSIRPNDYTKILNWIATKANI